MGNGISGYWIWSQNLFWKRVCWLVQLGFGCRFLFSSDTLNTLPHIWFHTGILRTQFSSGRIVRQIFVFWFTQINSQFSMAPFCWEVNFDIFCLVWRPMTLRRCGKARTKKQFFSRTKDVNMCLSPHYTAYECLFVATWMRQQMNHATRWFLHPQNQKKKLIPNSKKFTNNRLHEAKQSLFEYFECNSQMIDFEFSPHNSFDQCRHEEVDADNIITATNQLLSVWTELPY